MRATDKRTMPTSEGLLRLSLDWDDSIKLDMLVESAQGIYGHFTLLVRTIAI